MSELSQLVSNLVSIDSVNPDLQPGAGGESEIAAFVAAWFRAHGIETELQDAAPGRPNVIGIVRGTGGGRSLMLNAHMDTVGPGGMPDPLSGTIEGNRVYGRGAWDMKGSLAAIMLAAHDLSLDPPAGDVIVTAVVDEEYASIGTQAIVQQYTAGGAIVTEPTQLELSVAHKGFIWFDITTEGSSGSWLPPQRGRRCHRQDGQGADRDRSPLATPVGGDAASAPGHGLDPCLADPGRQRAVQLSPEAALSRSSVASYRARPRPRPKGSFGRFSTRRAPAIRNSGRPSKLVCIALRSSRILPIRS